MKKPTRPSDVSVSSSASVPVRVRRPATRWLLAAACAMSIVSVGAQGQTTRTVTNTNNDGAGSFRDILSNAEAGDTIRFSQAGTIQLTEQLLIDKTLSINPGGGRITLDGVDQSTRLLNITGGDVTIENVSFVNGGAQGGNGGSGGFAGGGGGAGLGGAVAIEGGNVTLIRADFRNNRAIGGNGGTGSDADVAENSASGQFSFLGGAGGGGASDGSVGVGGSSPADGTSFVSGVPGQRGADGGSNPPDPRARGGNFGAGPDENGQAGANGASRGGGGGGGPSASAVGGFGGDGGFGGGGGGAGDGATDDMGEDTDGRGGNGGTGGGGGAGEINDADMFPPSQRGGVRGIGGGNGEIIRNGGADGAGDGGGGAAVGGAIYLGTGATLVLEDTDFSQVFGNTILNGIAGGTLRSDPRPEFFTDAAEDGQQSGSFLFVQSGDETLTLRLSTDQNVDLGTFGDATQLLAVPGTARIFSSVTVTGAGDLTLVGDNDPFTNDSQFGGNIFVDGGNVIVSPTSSFDIGALVTRNGGSVFGTGIASTIVNDNGTVNPGSGPGEIGTLTLASDFSQNANGNLVIEFGAGGIDQLIVQDEATLNGELTLTEVSAGVPLDTPLTFFSAPTILGSFDNINTVFASGVLLTSAEVTVNPTDLQVTFTAVEPTFDLAGTTPGSRAVGNFINDLANSGDAGQVALSADIINAVSGGGPLVADGAFSPAVQQGLESQTGVVQNANAAGAVAAGTQANAIARSRVSGAGLGRGDTPDLLLLDVRSYDDLFSNPRATESPRGADPVGYDDGYDEVTLGDEDSVFETRPFSLWVEGVAGKGEIDSDSNGAGSETETTGITAGAEWLADDGRTVAGVFVGSTETTVEVDGLDDEGNIDSLLVGVYGSTPLGDGFSLNGSLSVGMLEFDSTRPTGSGTASSSSDGMAFNGSIELLKNISLDRRSVLSPFVGLEGSFVERDGFTETGAGVLNLDVEDATDEYLTGLVGLQWVGSYDVGKDLRLKPAARAGLGFQFLDESASTTSSFTSNPGTSFTSTGAERGSNSVRVGVSLELSPRLSNRWAVYGRYTGDFADGGNDHVGQVGVRFAF